MTGVHRNRAPTFLEAVNVARIGHRGDFTSGRSPEHGRLTRWRGVVQWSLLPGLMIGRDVPAWIRKPEGTSSANHFQHMQGPVDIAAGIV